MSGAGSLTQAEHSVLLHAFGLHGTTRATDAEIAERCDLSPEQVAEARQSGVAKMLQFVRSNAERFRAVADLLEAHPQILGELLQKVVPVLPPKPPRPKREPVEPSPVYHPPEPHRDAAVWDETLRAKVVRVDRTRLDYGTAHEFDTGCPGVLRFYVCRGDGWPSPYSVGIYWYPDDRHTAGTDWDNSQQPIRTTVGGESLVIAFDDAPAEELAAAREVSPFVWKDD